jgi:hypothetical protein
MTSKIWHCEKESPKLKGRLLKRKRAILISRWHHLNLELHKKEMEKEKAQAQKA